MLVEQALIISLCVLFLNATTWDHMIFAGIKRIISSDWTIAKPLYGCPICMCPWWGSLIYWIFFSYSWQDWLLTVGAASGFSVLYVVLLSAREFFIEKTK